MGLCFEWKIVRGYLIVLVAWLGNRCGLIWFVHWAECGVVACRVCVVVKCGDMVMWMCIEFACQERVVKWCVFV